MTERWTVVFVIIATIKLCLMFIGLSLDTVLNDVIISYIVFVSCTCFGRP